MNFKNIKDKVMESKALVGTICGVVTGVAAIIIIIACNSGSDDKNKADATTELTKIALETTTEVTTEEETTTTEETASEEETSETTTEEETTKEEAPTTTTVVQTTTVQETTTVQQTTTQSLLDQLTADEREALESGRITEDMIAGVIAMRKKYEEALETFPMLSIEEFDHEAGLSAEFYDFNGWPIFGDVPCAFGEITTRVIFNAKGQKTEVTGCYYLEDINPYTMESILDYGSMGDSYGEARTNLMVRLGKNRVSSFSIGKFKSGFVSFMYAY